MKIHSQVHDAPVDEVGSCMFHTNKWHQKVLVVRTPANSEIRICRACLDHLRRMAGRIK